eukprot:1871656-Ditylum_brightwellii.AAC.1
MMRAKTVPLYFFYCPLFVGDLYASPEHNNYILKKNAGLRKKKEKRMIRRRVGNGVRDDAKKEESLPNASAQDSKGKKSWLSHSL